MTLEEQIADVWLTSVGAVLLWDEYVAIKEINGHYGLDGQNAALRMKKIIEKNMALALLSPSGYIRKLAEIQNESTKERSNV